MNKTFLCVCFQLGISTLIVGERAAQAWLAKYDLLGGFINPL